MKLSSLYTTQSFMEVLRGGVEVWAVSKWQNSVICLAVNGYLAKIKLWLFLPLIH